MLARKIIIVGLLTGFILLTYGISIPPKVGGMAIAQVTNSLLPNQIFQSILPKLQGKTHVPIFLPSYIANEDETNPIYAIVDTVTDTEYVVALAFDPDCDGGNWCSYGEASGSLVTNSSPSLQGETVSLKSNLTGYFDDVTCGANCSDSTLTWDKNGYRYSVGIKAASQDIMLKVANSTVPLNGFRQY